MSQQKSKMPVLMAVVAVMIAAAGGFYFFSSGSETTDEAQVTASASADVETAAGDAKAGTEVADAAMDMEINTGEFVVEPGNPVVAKVDGKPISRVDVYRFIQTMPPRAQQMPATEVYPLAMEQVVNTRIVQNHADKANVKDTEEFKREMEMASQQIARNLYMQQQVDAKMSDSKLKGMYKEYIAGMPKVEERRARHILLDSEGKAKAAIDKIKAGGDFAALAAELSKGPTSKNGGDLGYFEKGRMVPEFDNAIFSKKEEGLMETPIKTQFGWHVVKLEDIRMRPNPTFEEMKPLLSAQMRREVLEGLLEGWRKDAKIEQFDINGKPLRDGADATGLLPEERAPQTNQKKDG